MSKAIPFIFNFASVISFGHDLHHRSLILAGGNVKALATQHLALLLNTFHSNFSLYAICI